MLRAYVYVGSAKTSGRVQKPMMSATSQATTNSTWSYVDREGDRGDDVRSGTSHPVSVRDGGREPRAASRSIASSRIAAAGRDRLSRHTRNAWGSVSSRVSRSPSPCDWRCFSCHFYLESSFRSASSRSFTINLHLPLHLSRSPSTSSDYSSILLLCSSSTTTSSNFSLITRQISYDKVCWK